MSAPHYYDPQWLKVRRIQNARQATHVEAAPVAEHVKMLLSAGAMAQWVATAAVVDKETIRRLAKPDVTGRVRVAVATRILSVTRGSAFAAAPGGALMPVVGTRRRIQAMIYIGWRHRDFADRGASDTVGIVVAGQRVQVRTYRAVERATRDMCTRFGPSDINRARAARLGYMPLGVWDDIDDPNEVPDCGAEPSRLAWVEDAEHMAEAGESAEGAAVRLGRPDGRSLGRALRHLGRQDLVDRFAANGSRAS